MIIVSPNGKIINFENLVEIYVTRYKDFLEFRAAIKEKILDIVIL